MQAPQGPEAVGALGGQHVGGAVAHLVALVGGHFRQQPVQGAVADLALGVAAIVVERIEPRPEHAVDRPPERPVVALRIGQGEGVPDGGLDGVLQVLVAGAQALVAFGELELGEEVAAEGLAAQVADVALLAVELGLGIRRHGRTGTGEQALVTVSPPARAEAHADAEPHSAQGDDQQDDRHRDRQQGEGRAAIVATPAATASIVRPRQRYEHAFRRRRRRHGEHRRIAVVTVHD